MLIAATLKSQGHEVQVWHDDISNPAPIGHQGAHFAPMSVVAPDDEMLAPLAAFVDEFQPDSMGISYVTADRASAHAVAKLAKARDIHTVAGGIHPSLLPDDELATGLFDTVCKGEGEGGSGGVFETEFKFWNAKPIENLDQVIADRQSVIGWERYPAFLRGMIQTQRGCPYSCGYCAAPQVFGSRVRTRDPGLVREEVESLDVDHGRIIDDSFAVVKSHGLAICKELAKTNYRWVCDMALQDADDERLDALVEGGCYCINVGIESAVKRWQALSGKHVKPLAPENLIIRAAMRKLDVHFYFMIGFPGETLNELWATLNYAERLKEMGATPCISIVTPYPKTKLWDLACEYTNMDDPDWTTFIHQNSGMGLAAVAPEEWDHVITEADRINE